MRQPGTSAGRVRRWAAGAPTAFMLALLAGAGMTACSASQPGPAHAPAAPVTTIPATPRSSPPAASASPGPAAAQAGAEPAIAGVTQHGAVVVLDPATGTVLRTLVAGGAFGDEISVANGRVYYAARHGCSSEIYSVPLTGGHATAVAAGAQPAVSPDGARLAYLREPWASGGQPAYQSCGSPASSVPSVSLVVRDLATGAETVYPEPPAARRSPFTYPVSHLSWSPGGKRLLLSMGEVQDGAGWALVLLDPAHARYYMSYGSETTAGLSRVAMAGDPHRYYREGVFLPDGNLLVNVVCQTPNCPAGSRANLIEEVSKTGGLVHQIAVGFAGRDHTSLDATGPWVLYLSGTDLYVSHDGHRPAQLTSGLIAAAWVPPASA